MNKEGTSNIEEVLSKLLNVVPSEIVDEVKRLREVDLRLETKLNEMHKKGEVSLAWVYEVFYFVWKGFFRGR